MERLPNYDHYKLDNGETRARFDYEPDKEIETPLTCQACGAEYQYSEKGATGGFCPWCNGVERRSIHPMATLIYLAHTALCFLIAWLIFAAVIFTPEELANNSLGFWALVMGVK